MEVIIVAKDIFDTLFQTCLDKLSLTTLEEQYNFGSHRKLLIDLRRNFHYEITELKNQLEKR